MTLQLLCILSELYQFLSNKLYRYLQNYMIAQNFVNRSLFCDNIKTISNGTKFAYHVTDAHVIDIYV